ncbi:MAG: hypothetical protein U0Z26_09150 [Anaerolineales bacterium]
MKSIYSKVLFPFFIILSACTPVFQTNQETQITNSPTTTNSTPLPPSLITTPTKQSFHQSKIELITDNAATGDGGNIWGGHQTRIVHTQDGIFTAYTVEGGGYLNREWRLVKRQTDGTWLVLAQGESGREPVNLLAAPNGTLYIVGWPGGVGTLWSGKPSENKIEMTSEVIPNLPTGNWPYSSAGIDSQGDLCILASNGGESERGEFYWSCLQPITNQWTSQVSSLDYRYCYTYVFPAPNGQLSLVSTRDVRWEALGYQKPADAFDYVFNAFGYWQTKDISTQPMTQLSFAEERPTEQYANVLLDAQMDAYLDTKGRMHILYWKMGATTNGASQSRHRIVSPSGEILFDEELPQSAGYYSRIFQDKEENFYLITSSGNLFPMNEDGQITEDPITLDLEGNEVEYSGFGLSVPRTGTPLSNTIDIVFPSGNEHKWLYFQISLP